MFLGNMGHFSLDDLASSQLSLSPEFDSIPGLYQALGLEVHDQPMPHNPLFHHGRSPGWLALNSVVYASDDQREAQKHSPVITFLLCQPTPVRLGYLVMNEAGCIIVSS